MFLAIKFQCLILIRHCMIFRGRCRVSEMIKAVCVEIKYPLLHEYRFVVVAVFPLLIIISYKSNYLSDQDLLAIKPFRGRIYRHQLKLVEFGTQVSQNLLARVKLDLVSKHCFLVHLISK